MVRIVLSLTVTDLDSFRRYREQEEMTLAQLLAQLRRETSPTEKMIAGSALHSILERPPADELDIVKRDGHVFHFAIDEELPLLVGRETSGKREYVVNGQAIELRGRVDAMDGLSIEDHKLSDKFDADRYLDKYQWRAYLSIFNARKFTYNVFVGKHIGTSEDGDAEWQITDLHRLSLYRYPELDADVERELGLYAAFAQQHLILPEVA